MLPCNPLLYKVQRPMRGLLCSLLAIQLCACAQVQPWERGLFTKAQMASPPYPMQNALRAHIHNSREAASGEATTAGGGCGCY